MNSRRKVEIQVLLRQAQMDSPRQRGHGLSQGTGSVTGVGIRVGEVCHCIGRGIFPGCPGETTSGRAGLQGLGELDGSC